MTAKKTMILPNLGFLITIKSDFKTKYHVFCPISVNFSRISQMLGSYLHVIYLILTKNASTI